jgi:hypothetical protein
MTETHSHAGLIAGTTGSGKGSMLWHPSCIAVLERGRTIRRTPRLGSGLRLPSLRRSRTARGR